MDFERRKRLSECCNAEIECNLHNKRNTQGAEKIWSCKKCGNKIEIKVSDFEPPKGTNKK